MNKAWKVAAHEVEVHHKHPHWIDEIGNIEEEDCTPMGIVVE